MRSFKSHLRELRKWLAIRWEARPRLRIGKALKDRWEVVQDWRQARREGSGGRDFTGRRTKKRRFADLKEWLSWRFDSRPSMLPKKRWRDRVTGVRQWFSWKWSNHPWTMAVLSLLLVSGIALVVFYGRVSEWNRQWRTERSAERALKAAAAGDWQAAERAARESLQQGGPIESLRVLVKAAREQNQPNALDIGVYLFGHPDASLADRLEVVNLALDSGDVVRAGAMLQALPEDSRDNADVLYQALRYALASGDLNHAVGLASHEAVGERWPEFELLVAENLVKRGDESLRGEALGRISRVLAHPDRDRALEAMRLLVTVPPPWISPKLAAAVVRRFGNDPGLGPTDRLHLAFFEIGLDQLAPELLVDSMVDKFRDGHLGPLTEWLLRIRAPDRVVALTDPEGQPGTLSLEVFENRMVALATLGSFARMGEELENAPARFPDVDVLAYRAAVAERLGNDAEAVVLWNRANKKADLDPDQNRFYRLARIAEQAGNTNRQMEALAKAIEHRFGYPPPARYLQPLFGWLYQQGDTERLLAISFRLLQREPGNPLLINNYHYLRALYGQPDPKAPEILQKLVTADPERPDYRDTLAFVLLRRGEPGAALAILDELGSEPAQLSQNGRAAYAAALVALGRAEEAEDLAATIDWSVFAPEEARILQALCTAQGTQRELVEESGIPKEDPSEGAAK